MITLNTKEKTNKSKMRVGRGIGSGKGKTSGRGVKGCLLYTSPSPRDS